jgi:hypothetical protein
MNPPRRQPVQYNKNSSEVGPILTNLDDAKQLGLKDKAATSHRTLGLCAHESQNMDLLLINAFITRNEKQPYRKLPISDQQSTVAP